MPGAGVAVELRKVGRHPTLGLRRLPLATLAVVASTAGMGVAQAVDRDLLGRLERAPAELHGEWWRVGTALFVQDGGVAGAVSNIAFLVVIGVIAEQILPRPLWLAQYFGIGLLAELVGDAWQPVGGGNSIAVCGLAGAVAVALWRADPRLPGYSVQVLLVWCGALLATLSATLFLPAVIVSVAAAALARRRQERHQAVNRQTAAAVVVTGAILSSATNIHGAALLGGVALALLLGVAP